jgi:hypothetical protein
LSRRSGAGLPDPTTLSNGQIEEMEDAMGTWNTGWEIGFPAETKEEMLLALVVRDLIYGTSFDVEAEDSDAEFAIDYTAGEELENGRYQLLLAAEIEGSDNAELIHAFTEQILEELLDEAEALLRQQQHLGEFPRSDVRFDAVPEDEERWDLVIPDWLAPDGAEVPFGFRCFDGASGDPVPDDATLDAHGRVIVVPFGETIHLVAIPAPVELPQHPHGENQPE